MIDDIGLRVLCSGCVSYCVEVGTAVRGLRWLVGDRKLK